MYPGLSTFAEVDDPAPSSDAELHLYCSFGGPGDPDPRLAFSLCSCRTSLEPLHRRRARDALHQQSNRSFRSRL
jgi:hypothetical protein